MSALRLPSAFLSVASLGTPKAYFPVKGWKRIGSLIASFALLSGSLLIYLYGLYVTSLASQQHGPAMIDDRLVLPAIAAFVLFLLGLAFGWSAYVNWNKGVVIYEKGFAYRDHRGLKPWRWEDILSLTAAITRRYTICIYTGTTHVYTLLNQQNERLVLNDTLQGVEHLAGIIEQKIFPLLYERSMNQFNRGQALTFGPLSLSQTELRVDQKSYPWTEVGRISIQKGIVRISKKDGGWLRSARITTASIPNLRVALSILDQIVGVEYL